MPEIKLYDADKFHYVKECTQILKKEFEMEVYTDDTSIVKAYQICLDYYVSEFEKESLLVDSLADVYGMMELYSVIASEQNKEKTSDDTIIMKRTLKFLFGELTKVDVKSSNPPIINDSNISRLWHLTNLIWELTQRIYTYYINSNTGCQFELYESYFGFTITDKLFTNKLNEIAELAKTTSVGGFQSAPPNTMSVFYDTAKKAFGDDVIDNLIDRVVCDDSPVIIDCDKISEKDFIEIISGRRIYDIKQRLCHEVVCLKDIYKKHSGNLFLEGLTLKSGTVNLKRNITHPHSTQARTRFRPILELNIDSEKHYLTTPFMLDESINEHITNQIPFDILPKEWERNAIMKEYAKKQKDEHSKWLDDSFEDILNELGLPFLRNKNSINGIDIENTPSEDGYNVGEIDFIIFDNDKNRIRVVECKYLKSYYDFASFILDKDKFEGGRRPKNHEEKSYNDQLRHKYNWVSNNINNVCAEFKNAGVNLESNLYSVDCFFLTDSKSYYSFISKYNIISRKEIKDYLIKE